MACYIVNADIVATIVAALKTSKEVTDFAQANGLREDTRVRARLAELEVSDLTIIMYYLCSVYFI
jgi:hypothetical protein